MGTWRESMWKMENGHDGRLEHGTQSEESENSSTDDKTEKKWQEGCIQGNCLSSCIGMSGSTAVSDQKKLESSLLDLYQQGIPYRRSL